MTLGLVISGVFIRMVRVNMLQTLRADYVEAARARGMSERKVLFRHAFRNALVPVVTIMGLQFALLLGGAILTETTFSWPGLGQGLVEFINTRDYAAVQGIVTFFAILVVSSACSSTSSTASSTRGCATDEPATDRDQRRRRVAPRTSWRRTADPHAAPVAPGEPHGTATGHRRPAHHHRVRSHGAHSRTCSRRTTRTSTATSSASTATRTPSR